MGGSDVDSVFKPAGGFRITKGFVLGAFVGTLSLAIAFIGAALVRDSTGIDGVNIFVETLSGQSSGYFSSLGLFAPLGFAFAAGMAAAFNPCGFAMLPAYMGLYLGTDDNDDGKPKHIQNLAKAILVGGSVTAGFVLLFSVAGVVIGLGARSLVSDVLPWLGLTIGIGLAVVGAWLVGGGKMYTGIAQRAADRFGNPNETNVRGYFLFGLSYGTASLSCTLPIFLAVIGTSFAVSSIATSIGQFVLYALGMGLIIITLTIGMALFKGAMVGAFRKALPYIAPVGSWLMVVAGTYIVFYWLTIGDLVF